MEFRSSRLQRFWGLKVCGVRVQGSRLCGLRVEVDIGS